MPRRRDDYDDDVEGEELVDAIDEDYGSGHGRRHDRKRRRSDFIDDVAEEDDEEEEEYEEDDEDYGGGGGNRRRGGKTSKKVSGAGFFELEADVDTDAEEDEEEDGEDDFIVNERVDLHDEENARRTHHHTLLSREDEQEDVEALERIIQERFARNHTNYDDDVEVMEVEQQALLPSVRDPKLWTVNCKPGHEREVAVCLMQKCIDRGAELQIRSVIALDHLKNYIYIEADKEAHVKEACKGMRHIYTSSKISMVPIKEMTDVLSVESKAIDLSRDSWVRMKTGNYKGDLAKVVDVDNVRQRVTVKLIPRIDLQSLTNKLGGREYLRKKSFTPPPRFMNIDEAREMHIRVEHRRDPMTGDYFENINGMMFKDGFLYKNVSMKTISTQNIQPCFDEIDKFQQPNKNGNSDIASLSMLLANRKKGQCVKGDRVIVLKGDLKNLKGQVEKVEQGIVHIKPDDDALPKTLAVREKELCKFFEQGNHVKIISGAQEGATGMVVTDKGHLVDIVSDTSREVLQVFSDNVVETSEVTSGITKIGDFELHDLVQLNNSNFGVIIHVYREAFQVLKGVAEKAEVELVRLRDIKYKINKKISAKDCYMNMVSAKDLVKVIEGPCKGRQGRVEHINRGKLFIYDRHHLEHAGFICAKSESCVLVGGSNANGDRNANPLASRVADVRNHARFRPCRGVGGPPISGGRHIGGGRGGKDSLAGSIIKIQKGHYKGYNGRVLDVHGTSIRVELESLMRIITINRTDISDMTTYRDTERCVSVSGSETPMHPSRTPLHPYMTPMRDAGAATPVHDGMRTPMRDRAWNPYAPMSPPRDSWEDGNPGSWGTSPRYQPGCPRSRAYEGPTPGSGWANTPGGSNSDADTPRDTTLAYGNAPSPYLPSTPGGKPPRTPSSAFLPGTPDGGRLDIMSPVVGEDNDGPLFLPDILVNVRRSGEDPSLGVIQEVLQDGACRVALGASGNGDILTANPSEIEVVLPKKSEKIKITGGSHRGATGKLIGVDGTEGIVKMDDTLDVKIVDIVILAKLVRVSS